LLGHNKVWRYSRYEKPLWPTHHHLICETCGKVFKEEELEDLMKVVAGVCNERMKKALEGFWDSPTPLPYEKDEHKDKEDGL
jgi:hypothetical protein